MNRTRKISGVVFALLLTATGLQHRPAFSAESIVVQSTTSTANSGLYDHLLPLFHEDTGIDVNVVAVGTGQAIRNAVNCDGDVLLVHAKQAELAFVQRGHGVERFDLMYNDFVIVGPAEDPAGIAGSADVLDGLGRILATGALFTSRGDDSGTHKAEIRLWEAAGLDPSGSSGKWYRETGSGMGATLNTAVGMNAYTMSDRATWISFRNKGNLEILIEGDQRLFNQYGVVLVAAEKCRNVNTAAGQTFIDWLLSSSGQRAISNYRIDGQQLFFPSARP